MFCFNVMHVSFLLFCATDQPKCTEISIHMNEINIYKLFIRLKMVKTSKITSSQKRLVFKFFHHFETVFNLVNILSEH